LTSEPPVADESDEERHQRWYLRKVAGGGFVIQLCALLLAWLAVEDVGMRAFIRENGELDEIRETIEGLTFLEKAKCRTTEECRGDQRRG
jgi:hypothetical protein